MESPLARFLTRFPTDADVIEEASVFEPITEVDDPIDAEAERIHAACAEVEVRAERRIAELKDAHAAATALALAEARAAWCDAEGAALGQRLDGALAELHRQLDQKIADALTPLVVETVVDRARAVLTESLDLILTDPDHPVVTLRGPGDLIDAIQRSRPDAAGIDYVAHDELDAVMTAHGVRIETRLEAALATLAGA